jgi:hypothetical protein
MKAQKILGHAALCLLPLGMFAQERADYQLKGVPAVEVTRFENGSDLMQVLEFATLNRDKTRRVLTITWEAQEVVDSLSTESHDRVLGAVAHLGQQLAAAFLAANQVQQ